MPSVTTKPWNGHFCMICGFTLVSDAEGEHCEACLHTIICWLNLVFGLDMACMTQQLPDGSFVDVPMSRAIEIEHKLQELLKEYA